MLTAHLKIQGALNYLFCDFEIYVFGVAAVRPKKCESNCWLLTKYNPEVQFRILLAFGQIIVCHGIPSHILPRMSCWLLFLPLQLWCQSLCKEKKKDTLCSPNLSGVREKCLGEPKHFIHIFSVCRYSNRHSSSVVRDGVVIPPLLPRITECCHSWLPLNRLPLVFYFEGGFIGFLSRSCAGRMIWSLSRRQL